MKTDHAAARRQSGWSRLCCWARRHAAGLNSSPIRRSTTPAGESVPALDVNANAAALLPGSVTSRGVLRVAIPTNEPPTQFYKEGSRYMTGVNPDIARLIGEALGLDVEIKVVNFDSIIPGMAAGRYDMTVSSMTPTDKRIAVIDFVDYMQVGNAIAVAKGKPPLTQDTLCGKRVGVLIGSYQLTTNIPDYDEKCVAAGRPPIQTSQFQDTRQAISALTSARLDAVLADSPILEFAATQNPDVVIAENYDFTPGRRRGDQRTPTGERRRGGSGHRHHQWRIPRSARRSTDWIPRRSPRPASTRLNKETHHATIDIGSRAGVTAAVANLTWTTRFPLSRFGIRSGRSSRSCCSLFAAVAAWNVATNHRFGWDVVASYLFAPEILRGALLTVVLTVISMIAGVALGTVLAVMRISDNPIFSRISQGFIWFFRGTPLLVQLIFWYNIAALYPTVSIGIPFGGPHFVLGSANTLITPLAAALLGLSLNEAAYMAEIIRGGIGSVDKGQYDAAHALGMNNLQLMRRVVLPQAMRVVLPPTGNEVISMLKATSLVSVLAISDLLYSAQIIYSLNYRTIPLLIVASFWYLLMTSILSYFQNKLENHYGRGFATPATTKRRRLALRRTK